MSIRSVPQSPSILLYNPISGHGHLDSWNAMFVSILLEAGWRVNALTPDAQDLLKRLKSKNLANLANLNVLDWDVLRPNFLQRVSGRVQRLLSTHRDNKESKIQSKIQSRSRPVFSLGLRCRQTVCHGDQQRQEHQA